MKMKSSFLNVSANRMGGVYNMGIRINGIKYIQLMNDNEFKKKSLCDNVYFTLRDIFANAESTDTVMEANYFNSRLTNKISFEERTEGFEYTNELHQPDYVDRLQIWLKRFNIYYFEFIEPDEDEDIDMNEYMKWDDWWDQFMNLRQLLEESKEVLLTNDFQSDGNKVVP